MAIRKPTYHWETIVLAVMLLLALTILTSF